MSRFYRYEDETWTKNESIKESAIVMRTSEEQPIEQPQELTEKQKALKAEQMGIDYAAPGSDKTIMATYANGKIESIEEIKEHRPPHQFKVGDLVRTLCKAPGKPDSKIGEYKILKIDIDETLLLSNNVWYGPEMLIPCEPEKPQPKIKKQYSNTQIAEIIRNGVSDCRLYTSITDEILEYIDECNNLPF